MHHENLHFLAKDGEVYIQLVQDCSLCGKPSTIVVKAEQFFAWLSGEHLKQAFPDLSSTDLKVLMSGLHSDCWAKKFDKLEKEELTA